MRAKRAIRLSKVATKPRRDSERGIEVSELMALVVLAEDLAII